MNRLSLSYENIKPHESGPSDHDVGRVRAAALSTSLSSPSALLFGREQRQKMCHSVAKVGSMVSPTTSLKAQLVLWETDIQTTLEQFGCDVFDVMNRNRNAGVGTGGEVEASVVEIFADAATDIRFMMDQSQELQRELSRACTCSSTSQTTPTDDNPVYKQQEQYQHWRSSIAKMIGMKPKSLHDVEVNKIQVRIESLNQAIQARKQRFGIQLYRALVSLGEKHRSNDPKVDALFDACQRDVRIPLEKSQYAKEALRNFGNTISHEELKEFVDSHPRIWAMLSVNCQIPEEECKEVAFRVALELVSGRSGHDASETIITKSDFKRFQRRYIDNDKGHQEFFHRTVFMAFDEDWNGVLNMEEIDKLLDTYYVSGSIFQGDSRLPSKEELKKQILEQHDDNGDGLFSFDEIRSLISGRGDRVTRPIQCNANLI